MPSVYEEPFAFTPMIDPYESMVRACGPMWRLWADASLTVLGFWFGAAARVTAPVQGSDIPGEPAAPVGPEIDVPNAPEELPPAVDPQPQVDAPPPATTDAAVASALSDEGGEAAALAEAVEAQVAVQASEEGAGKSEGKKKRKRAAETQD